MPTGRATSSERPACAQVDIPPEEVERKGRLMPGNIFLVDFERHELVTDEEVRPIWGVAVNPAALWRTLNRP